jgi:hypothetical protein
MIKQKDAIVGNKFFFANGKSKKPHLIKIIQILSESTYRQNTWDSYFPYAPDIFESEFKGREIVWHGKPETSISGIRKRDYLTHEDIFLPGRNLDDVEVFMIVAEFSNGNTRDISSKELYHSHKEAKLAILSRHTYIY